MDYQETIRKTRNTLQLMLDVIWKLDIIDDMDSITMDEILWRYWYDELHGQDR